jgi:hypothetical protein
MDLARLGRSLGARRACGVLVSPHRVVVIDVPTMSEVGETSADDANSLQALIAQPVTLPMGDAMASDGSLTPRSYGPREPSRVLFVAGLSVAAAGVGGLVLGVVANVRTNSSVIATDQAPYFTDIPQSPSNPATWQSVAIAGYAAGGVLAVAGAVLAVIERPRDRGARLRPMASVLGDSGVWTGVHGTF